MIFPALALAALSACAQPRAQVAIQTREVVADGRRTYGGVLYPRGTRLTVGLSDPEAVLHAVLGAAAVVGGKRWEKGAELELGGATVMAATLAAPQDVGGTRFQAGVRADFDADGRLREARSTDGRPLDIRGVRYSAAPQAGSVQFHASTQRVSRGRLDGAQTVGGVVLAAGSDVSFHPEGGLDTGTLAGTQRVDGVELAAGSLVSLWPGGRLRFGVLDRPQRVAGWPAERYLTRYRAGPPEYICLAEDRRVPEMQEGRCCRAGEQLHLDEAGKPIGWSRRCQDLSSAR